jgi:hypothetical protein
MDWDFGSGGMAAANAAQTSWFNKNPVLPNYGQVAAGQGINLPAANTVPQPNVRPNVLGIPKPMSMEDRVSAANAAQKAYQQRNPVVPNAVAGGASLLDRLSNWFNGLSRPAQIYRPGYGAGTDTLDIQPRNDLHTLPMGNNEMYPKPFSWMI